MMTITEITDGGLVMYDESFFSKEISDALFDYLLNKVPWKQEKGKYTPFPRLTAWYADSGLTYTYSGVTHHGILWSDQLLEVKKRVSKIAEVEFNSLLLNLYRDGNDSIGFHSDAEPELGNNPIIASISLG